MGVTPTSSAPVPAAGAPLIEIYDRSLPQVYGYLLSRCGEKAVAEDLTSETFLAAAAGVGPRDPVTVGWLLGVARHKLADHWRRQARQERLLQAVASGVADPDPGDDTWDVTVDVMRARQLLARLVPQHRAALALRYLDGLSVPEVAALLERTVHATEALLVRARRELRNLYEEEDGADA
jgi:RNA polymerase sigma-70 factor (ECF subfamily)